MIVLGYVGRLSVEKNVSLLPHIDGELRGLGVKVKWLIVGHGAEEGLLRRAMPQAAFAGVLRGDELLEAYANMDLLVFPSHTDTFGNVVLEALASGVPAIVTHDGGPANIVRDRETGRITPDIGFARAIAEIVANREEFVRMRAAAREYALGCTWDAVFERMVAEYPVAR
jgi:glycosyltransferase involved in cell wall biosynthesis